MRKSRMLLIVFVLVLVVSALAIGQSQIMLWQNIDGNDYLGGVCHSFTIVQCTGSPDECDSVTCSSFDGGQSWTCNATSYQRKTGGTYGLSCPIIESGTSGWPDCSTAQYECSKLETCSQACYKNIASGLWYCNTLPAASNPTNVTHHFPSNPTASCQ